jgi:hypothetical protein
VKEVVAIFVRAPGARPVSVPICLLLADRFQSDQHRYAPAADQHRRRHHDGQTVEPLTDRDRRVDLARIEARSRLPPAVPGHFAVDQIGLVIPGHELRGCRDGRGLSAGSSPAGQRDAPRPLELLYGEHPGTLSHAISSEAAESASAYSAAANTVAEAVKRAISLLIAVLVSGTFFAVAAVGAACVAFPMTWLIKMLRRNKKRQWKYTSKLVDDAHDAFSNIKALRSMQRQGVVRAAVHDHYRQGAEIADPSSDHPSCANARPGPAAAGTPGARSHFHSDHRLHQRVPEQLPALHGACSRLSFLYEGHL